MVEIASAAAVDFGYLIAADTVDVIGQSDCDENEDDDPMMQLRLPQH